MARGSAQRVSGRPSSRPVSRGFWSCPFGARGGRGVVAAYIGAGALWVATLSSVTARADSGDTKPFVFEVPPAPAKVKARFAFEVHTGFSAPLDHSSLCPSDAVGCVMENGGGVGSSAELRWPVGLGVMGGYDLWFLDTDSVFELGVQQLLRGGLRYTVPTNYIFHPTFEFGAGLMLYGDTFYVATAGFLMQPVVGTEVELTETVALRVGFGLRVFTHTTFTTERDGVRRGDSGTFSESFYLEVGLVFL
jgi:hypothetical protein